MCLLQPFVASGMVPVTPVGKLVPATPIEISQVTCA